MSPDFIDKIGTETEFSKRKRTIVPHALVMALLTALAGGAVRAIADLQRQFNQQQGLSVFYKPFYNRLARKTFAKFMRTLVMAALTRLVTTIAKPGTASPLARFKDIVLQDGTSFAVKKNLPRAILGGLSAVEPQVRLHVSMSAFDDSVKSVALTGNLVSETQRRVSPQSLADKLYLGDRGFADWATFASIVKAKGDFIVRLSKSWNPQVVAIHHQGQRIMLPSRTRRRLNDYVKSWQGITADLIVNVGSKKTPFLLRVVVIPSQEPHGTRLCTSLIDCNEFSAQDIGDTYRLRWQIELLFKEWKSFTNLHKWDTKNPYIVEGLIWASLLAALLSRNLTANAALKGTKVLSTQVAAKSAMVWLRDLVSVIARNPRRIAAALDKALQFLLDNATRKNLKRDRKTGKFRSLTPIWEP